MDPALLVWLDAWRGPAPRSQVLQALVVTLRQTVEGIAEVTANPAVDRAYRAQEALRAAKAGEDVPAGEVLALVEAILEGRVAS